MAGKIKDWPVMEIKSETRERILKSVMRQVGTMLVKYKLARSWVKGGTPFERAVRAWYDLKIKFHSGRNCKNCKYTGCPGQVGMCEGYKPMFGKISVGIGEPE